MCGVAGVVALGEELTPEDGATVDIMVARLWHRGPDQAGRVTASRCILGNTRLSVMDLSDAGSLPMSSADGNIHLAYNGEITNFRELRKQFDLDATHTFRSSSDAEVLIALYERLGIDCVRHLTGMFAFFLVDEREKKAYVVRDFFGLRPLFWAHVGRRIYVSSEIKSLVDVPGLRPSLNVEGFYHYFTLGYIPGERTPFNEIEELHASHMLEIDLVTGAFRKRRYYELRYDPNPAITEEDIVEPLYGQLRDAVDRNLVSDARLGFTLSGGIDSSSIVTLARELRPDAELHTYSIKMESASFDESRWQRIVADDVRSVHHEISVGPQQVVDHFLEHLAYMDEPSGDGAAVPSFLLAREARKNVKVLMSGEGGDEVFNAYETHGASRARTLYRRWVPEPVRSVARFTAHLLPVSHKKLSFDFVAKRFTTGVELSPPESHIYWRHALSEADKRALMPRALDTPSTGSVFSELFERLDFDADLDRISWLDIYTYFIDDLMVKNDRTFMANSVEARFPLMDRHLAEFVAQIPESLRLKGFRRRYLQKRAMEGHLHPEILARKNMGLELPHSGWFLGGLRPIAEQWLSDEAVERTGILDVDTVRRLWREHESRRHDHGRALWCIVNLTAWYALFMEPGTFREHLAA
jgi:asparagine synthase (glutamine-hydrolysing)